MSNFNIKFLSNTKEIIIDALRWAQGNEAQSSSIDIGVFIFSHDFKISDYINTNSEIYVEPLNKFPVNGETIPIRNKSKGNTSISSKTLVDKEDILDFYNRGPHMNISQIDVQYKNQAKLLSMLIKVYHDNTYTILKFSPKLPE